MSNKSQNHVTSLTVQLLSAFVSKNKISSDELTGLIKTTRLALTESLSPSVKDSSRLFTPAVSIRQSLSSADSIISLIDGKPYKTLKRHLAKHGLTPKTYRERFGLTPTYPMVAPSYSDTRRAIAQKLGRGKERGTAANARSNLPKKTTPDPSSEVATIEAGTIDSVKPQTNIASAKGSSTAKPPRRKLSIAAPKEPKSFKAALEAAADHLSFNATER